MERLIHLNIENGITSFDHADIYGSYTTESDFGAVLKIRSDLRNQIRITTKCGIKMVSENRPKQKIKSYDLGEEYRVWNFANSGTTGESTGDLIDTNSSTHTDSDKDGSASLTISAIRTGTEAAGTGTSDRLVTVIMLDIP